MTSNIHLPGFRFHPTEEELLDFYLKNIVLGKRTSSNVIGMLNIYRHDPSELPGLACIMGEREWYFFVPRDRKHGVAGRPNRTTETGYWKATGSDRKIMKSSDHHQRLIGFKKTLVFYMGRAPRGSKTDWVMNEYRLPDHVGLSQDMVLCKIYRKATSMKVLEQRAAMEEVSKIHQLCSSSSPTSPIDAVSFSSPDEELTENNKQMMKKEDDESSVELKKPKHVTSSLKLPSGTVELPELQLPRFTSDWTQDSFWMQFNSPWLQSLMASPTSIINF